MSWQQGLCPALYPPLRQSLQFPRDHRPQAAWGGADDLADQSLSLLVFGRCRPDSRLKIRIKDQNQDQGPAYNNALGLVRCCKSSRSAMSRRPTNTHAV